jgi:hypothetical protein
VDREFKKLESAVDEISFSPGAEHKQVKAAYWAKMTDDPTALSRESVTLNRAIQVTGCTKLRRWWSQPGFQEWFSNGEEWKQKLLYIIDVGLDALLEVFADPNPKTAAAKVRAFEVACRLAGREPARAKEVRFVDKAINDMSPAQLQSFLESRGYMAPVQSQLEEVSNEEATETAYGLGEEDTGTDGKA